MGQDLSQSISLISTNLFKSILSGYLHIIQLRELRSCKVKTGTQAACSGAGARARTHPGPSKPRGSKEGKRGDGLCAPNSPPPRPSTHWPRKVMELWSPLCLSVPSSVPRKWFCPTLPIHTAHARMHLALVRKIPVLLTMLTSVQPVLRRHPLCPGSPVWAYCGITEQPVCFTFVMILVRNVKLDSFA